MAYGIYERYIIKCPLSFLRTAPNTIWREQNSFFHLFNIVSSMGGEEWMRGERWGICFKSGFFGWPNRKTISVLFKFLRDIHNELPKFRNELRCHWQWHTVRGVVLLYHSTKLHANIPYNFNANMNKRMNCNFVLGPFSGGLTAPFRMQIYEAYLKISDRTKSRYTVHDRAAVVSFPPFRFCFRRKTSTCDTIRYMWITHIILL